MAADKTDFTQGSILKKMVAFMIPLLGALILQAAYGAVDLLVVGRYGSTSGLSAVSTGSQVLNLVTFVVTQLAMGVTVLIARYLGEKRAEQIGSVIGGSAVVFAGYFNGVVCTSDFCSDAGTKRGSYPYIKLCAYLRMWNFLYRGI